MIPEGGSPNRSRLSCQDPINGRNSRARSGPGLLAFDNVAISRWMSSAKPRGRGLPECDRPDAARLFHRRAALATIVLNALVVEPGVVGLPKMAHVVIVFR